MSKVEISKIKDDIFGNLIKITNGIVELKVTVDFGPRVIHFSRIGMENMLYQDKEMKSIGEFHDVYDGDIIKLYGGHRIWMSPEIMPHCYYPDNRPVKYNELADKSGVEFLAPVEKFTNLQKTLVIKLDENSPKVYLNHIIKNCSAWTVDLAPWAITMLDAGGKQIMPIPKRKTGLLHNRSFSFWDYAQMNDPRIFYGKDYITLTQDKNMIDPFKIGYNNEDGWAAYFNKGQVFLKLFESEIDGDYPDNGCSFETYTCDFMLEMETLGQMDLLDPDESVEHFEEWMLYEESNVPSNNEEEIRKSMSKYIEPVK